MMKVKYYKCHICNKKFKTLNGWGNHIQTTHPETIPAGYSISRYFYFTKTGKTHGICRTCKGDTDWNEESMKYNQYCSNPECKKAYVKIAKQRMIGKYGKVHLLNDPDIQRKMLENRKISGKYKFKDGQEFEYVGSYEKEFLKMLDTLMQWPSNDLISPSPHTYYYEYKNNNDDKKNWGRKFYIPDFYIPSLNLEIEIKQSTSTNKEFNTIMRVKEKLKDDVMTSNPNLNYIKINDNNFTNFFEFLLKAKENIETPEEIKKDQIGAVMESYNNENVCESAKSNANNELYFVSRISMDDEVLRPRIPDNCFTKSGYEDSHTPRICFAPSIDQCLMALSQNLEGMELYVHVPKDVQKVVYPTKNKVPDCEITGEVWVTKPVTLQCIGKIKVEKSFGDGVDFSYGKNTASLYKWKWKWLYKFDENHNTIVCESYKKKSNIDSIDFLPATESLFINKGVFDVHFDKFESGESNVVLITGLSGSGKTTLGTKIASKYKAELIELDCFEQCYIFKNDDQLKQCGEVFYQYLSSHKALWEKLKRKEIHGKELNIEIEKFLKYAIAWCKKDKHNRYVIEGVQIYSFLNKEKISGVPLLIVGTSALKSLVRRLIRAKENNKEDFRNQMKELPQCIAWYIDENKMFEKFKKSVLESYLSINDISNESYVFSKDDIERNIDKFISGESNILLITGLSRAGKTTLGEEYADKYNAELIELDIFENPNSFVDDYNDIKKVVGDIYDMYLNKTPEGKVYRDRVYNKNENISFDELSIQMGKTIKWVLKYCKSHPNKKYIIEGLQIYSDIDDFDSIKDLPLIIKGTSMLKCFIRRKKHKFKTLLWYIEEEKKLNQLRDANESYSDAKNESYNGFSVSYNIPRIIKSWGIVDDKGLYNKCLKVIGFDKPLRGRSEMLIIHGDKLFLALDNNGNYKIPGGGWEQNENHMDTAIRETREEVRINVKNIRPASAYITYSNKPTKWVMETIPEKDWWYGCYTEVYIGEYDSKYMGKIDDYDKDSMINVGKFYKISDIYDNLLAIHKNAITDYISRFQNGDRLFIANESTLTKWGYKGWHYVSDRCDLSVQIDEDLTYKTVDYALLGYIQHKESSGKKYKVGECERVYHYTFNPNSNNPNIPILTGAINLRFPRDNSHEFDWEWAYAEDNVVDNNKPVIATEGFFNIFNIFKKEKSLVSSWKDVLLSPKGLFGGKMQPFTSLFTGARIVNGMIEIRGINYRILSNRIEKMYVDKSINNIFIPEYNTLSYKKYEKKKIQRRQIKIDYLYTPEFFALELVCLFRDLGKRFNDKVYKSIANQIYENSWLFEADRKSEETSLLDTKNLSNISLELEPHQLEFIQNYPKLKAQLNLNGYILAFEQGLGKTLTSTALAECLDVDHVYIICPNSLKENWALELRKYYKKYDDDDLWKSEVFICNNKSFLFDPNVTKFIITNNESIDKMFPYVMSGKNMLILDESHNFRNIKSKRVAQLLELRDKLKCSNTLIMSGTPIKATPDEIVPVLMMIDPTFTMEAAKIFAKAFKLKESLGTTLVQTRFGRIMYRKDKSVMENKLPEKHVEPLLVTAAGSDKYLMENVRSVIMDRFVTIFKEGEKDMKKLREPFFSLADKFAKPTFDEKTRFHKIVNEFTQLLSSEIHEIDRDYVTDYIARAKGNMKSNDDKKYMDFLTKNYLRYRQHCLGVAMGEILPKYRKEMFISMYNDNRDKFYKMINENTKKTLIFSQFKDVVTHIYNDLNNVGIGTVMINGDITNRMEILQEFKENDSIMVLIATSQTLGTGVTLTEASQMFFFGPPWRQSDFNQCADRIHRIGQTDDVYIYNVILNTGNSLNLSTRMDDILQWSKKMTDSVITVTDDSEIDDINFDTMLFASESATQIAIDEFNMKEDRNPLNIYKEVDPKLLPYLIEHREFYNCYKAIAKESIPKNYILEKFSIHQPLDGDRSFDDLQFSKLGLAVYANPEKTNANVKFDYHYDNGYEYWNLVTTKEIKKGTYLAYNASDGIDRFPEE